MPFSSTSAQNQQDSPLQDGITNSDVKDFAVNRSGTKRIAHEPPAQDSSQGVSDVDRIPRIRYELYPRSFIVYSPRDGFAFNMHAYLFMIYQFYLKIDATEPTMTDNFNILELYLYSIILAYYRIFAAIKASGKCNSEFSSIYDDLHRMCEDIHVPECFVKFLACIVNTPYKYGNVHVTLPVFSMELLTSFPNHFPCPKILLHLISKCVTNQTVSPDMNNGEYIHSLPFIMYHLRNCKAATTENICGYGSGYRSRISSLNLNSHDSLIINAKSWMEYLSLDTLNNWMNSFSFQFSAICNLFLSTTQLTKLPCEDICLSGKIISYYMCDKKQTPIWAISASPDSDNEIAFRNEASLLINATQLYAQDDTNALTDACDSLVGARVAMPLSGLYKSNLCNDTDALANACDSLVGERVAIPPSGIYRRFKYLVPFHSHNDESLSLDLSGDRNGDFDTDDQVMWYGYFFQDRCKVRSQLYSPFSNISSLVHKCKLK
eukprot:GHVL01037804.1.p1 GENE.GHVL01037804.1~~GHVL01037804.1.p1  ORF type:complete len:491 (+),score=16.57 GHVL01037804.1:33-1505(+)